MKRNSIQFFSSLLLILTAMIWGVAFVAQSYGGDRIGSFAFNGYRFMLGGLAMIPLALVRQKRHPAGNDRLYANPKRTLTGGILCGFVLFVSSSLQQSGIILLEGSVGKAGFITALYIVIVPILSALFLRKNPPPVLWFCVVLASVGMYLLCIKGAFSLAFSDVLLILCAFSYSGHILVVEHFSADTDGIQLSCVQLLTSGILGCSAMLFTGIPSFEDTMAAGIAILYSGLFSAAIGYTLQVVAQKNLPSTLASLLMSLESVFSVLAAWVILHQALSGREIAGCVLMFCAVILAQLPPELFRLRRRNES